MKIRARAVGGNALLVTKMKNPVKYSSAIEISTEMIRVSDFASPTDTLLVRRKPGALKPEKGTWDLRISMPWAHKYLFHPNGENHKNSGGFMGIGIGADYYHRNNQYASLQFAIISDVPFPFPGAMRRDIEEDKKIQLCIHDSH